MKCSNCGNFVADDDLFCGSCGKKIVREEAPTEPQNTEYEWDPRGYDVPEYESAPDYDDSVPPPSWEYEANPGRANSGKKKNGKKIGILLTVVVLVVGLGVGAYFVLPQLLERKSPNEPAQPDAVSDQTTQPQSSKNSDDGILHYVDPDSIDEESDVVEVVDQEDEESQETGFDDSATGSRFRSDLLPDNIEKADSYFNYRPKIVQADANVTLRRGPSISSDKVYSVARRSLVYEVAVSRDKEWSLIYYRYYNRYGWMANRFLVELTDVSINEQSLEDGSVRINGKTIGVGNVNIHNYKVNEPYGLVLRDADSKDGEWILRMEDGDSIKEICRSKANPEWGYVEYNDGIKAYRGFAHSDYYG